MSGPFLLWHQSSGRYLWAATETSREVLLADPEYGSEFTDVTGDRTHEMAAAEAALRHGGSTRLEAEEATFLMGEIDDVPDAVPGLACLEPWYFTFCSNDPRHANCYVKFYGTYASAREQMRQHFGEYWAFQYSHDQKAECIDQWGLTEIKMS